MIFIETSIFTKQLSEYLPDDNYRKLQHFLLYHPDAGTLIQGTGGLRKLRWTINDKGKRGGIRVIYYWQMVSEHIYLMTLYSKNEMTDLSAKDKKLLKHMLEGW